MKILVTGATGMAGSEVVRQCIADSEIGRVTALSRRPLAMENDKLRVIVHDDFLDYSPILSQLAGHDAALWCLGISQTRVSQQEYQRITLDFTVAGARAMAKVNSELTFCFLSGGGADSAEKSRILFARVKGRTANELGKLGLPHLYCFRPGYIHPSQSHSKLRWEERFFSPLAPLLDRWFPSTMIRSTDLARAMIHVAKHGADQRILENNDIRRLAGR